MRNWIDKAICRYNTIQSIIKRFKIYKFSSFYGWCFTQNKEVCEAYIEFTHYSKCLFSKQSEEMS